MGALKIDPTGPFYLCFNSSVGYKWYELPDVIKFQQGSFEDTV